MGTSTDAVGWSIVALVLIALAVPWFLWGSSDVVAGLPVWIWWHVGWMALAAVVFAAFARYGWGVGVESSGARESGDGPDSGEVRADG